MKITVIPHKIRPNLLRLWVYLGQVARTPTGMLIIQTRLEGDLQSINLNEAIMAQLKHPNEALSFDLKPDKPALKHGT